MAEFPLPSFTPAQRKWLKEKYPDIRFLSMEPFARSVNRLVRVPDGTFHNIVFPPSSCCFCCSGEVAYAIRSFVSHEQYGSYKGWAVENVEVYPYDSNLYITTATNFRGWEVTTEFYLLIFLAPLHIPVYDAQFYIFVTSTPQPYSSRIFYTYDKPVSSTVDYSITYWSRFRLHHQNTSGDIPSILEECSKNPIDPSVDFDSIAWYAYAGNPAYRFVSAAFDYLSPRVTKYFEQSEEERFEQFKQQQKEPKND